MLTNDGIPADRLVVVHSGIDLDAVRAAAPFGVRARLGLADDSLIAVTVGALVPHKDHATLIHAARRLSERFPALHWVIAGDGELLSVHAARMDYGVVLGADNRSVDDAATKALRDAMAKRRNWQSVPFVCRSSGTPKDGFA